PVEIGADHRAFIPEVVGGYHIGTAFTAAGEAGVEIVHGTGAVGHILPVGIHRQVQLLPCCAGIVIRHVVDAGELVRFREFVARDGLHAGFGGGLHFHGAFAAFFGGDDEHAVGGAGAVDRSGGGIFQYLYGFNVVRVEVAVGRGDHSVYYIQGIGACKVFRSPDLDLRFRAGQAA